MSKTFYPDDNHGVQRIAGPSRPYNTCACPYLSFLSLLISALFLGNYEAGKDFYPTEGPGYQTAQLTIDGRGHQSGPVLERAKLKEEAIGSKARYTFPVLLSFLRSQFGCTEGLMCLKAVNCCKYFSIKNKTPYIEVESKIQLLHNLILLPNGRKCLQCEEYKYLTNLNFASHFVLRFVKIQLSINCLIIKQRKWNVELKKKRIQYFLLKDSYID